MQKKILVVANWKMNPQSGSEARKLFTSVQTFAHKLKSVETVICPPMPYLDSLGSLVKKRNYVLGAQDCFYEKSGSFTGEVSPEMIFNAKGRYVIVGHSERRALGESEDIIVKKVRAVLEYPLIPIICIGETKRDPKGVFLRDVRRQVRDILKECSHDMMDRIVLCYEPVWAISSQGQRASTPSECHEMIHAMRQEIADYTQSTALAIGIPILYGGSVNEQNAHTFLTEGSANGLLIGRASLHAPDMKEILKRVDSIARQ